MTRKIETRIVNVTVKGKKEHNKVYHPPIKRPRALQGTTYKLKPPVAEDAFYVTITNHEVHGQLRPFEIFIQSKNMDSYQWISVLCRMLSALMRQPHDEFPEFILDEMLSTFDPHGGYRMGTKTWYPSLVAEIGSVIREHWRGLASSPPLPPSKEDTTDSFHPESVEVPADVPSKSPTEMQDSLHEDEEFKFIEQRQQQQGAAGEEYTGEQAFAAIERALDSAVESMAGDDVQEEPRTMTQCGKCHQFTVRYMDGCMTCISCGDSKCA